MVPINEKWTAILSLLFQYSLCRVVLMVPTLTGDGGQQEPFFQYSLCRVVLMVHSRKDWIAGLLPSFSTRSVESF